MFKIAHIYPHGCQNAGDIYLIWAVKKMFAPAQWVDINAKQVFANVDVLNQCDVVLIGGGGLILPDSFNFVSPSGWQVGITADLIPQIKPPIIVYAVGWNLFRNQQPSDIFKPNISEMVQCAKFFSLRHKGDVEKLESYTGIENKIRLNFCPSIVAEPWRKIESSQVAFQLAGDRLETRVGNIDNFVRNIYKLGESLAGKKYLVAHTIGDLELQKYIDFKFVNLVGQPPKVVRDFYYSIDTVFTMRGHGQMIPLGLGCKVVSLISHDKIRNLLCDLSMLETGVEVQEKDFVANCLLAYDAAQSMDFYAKRSIAENNIKNNMEVIKGIIS